MSSDDKEDKFTSSAKGAVGFVGELVRVAGDNPDTRHAGRELGKAALTLAKTINVCLLPLAAINFGAEKARAYFNGPFPDQLAEKAKGIPQENIVEPKASIAGPALQGLAFSHEETNLREMYLNLLRTAMDSRVADCAHPAFVEVIKQLQAKEAELLEPALVSHGVSLLELRYTSKSDNGYKVFATHVAPLTDTETGEQVSIPNFPAMVDNWVRLGLVDVKYDAWFSSESRYSFIEERPEVKELRAKFPADAWSLKIQRGKLMRTAFGELFAQAVGLHDGAPLSASEQPPPA